ncbi:MAG: isoprenylcysteine carboxylmethyltransferase family protein [Desulfocapsa sp.]|nr:isoprenylcysteine carboxylmethyltransferase family protein [Desulfocapsa sp.]
MIRIGLFVICSLFFLSISRRSLKNPGTHGFYRFFVFEGILVLVLLNHPHWFRNPFSLLQILSWLLLLCAIFFVIQSLLMLKKKGGHAERQEMPENHAFENTVNVVEEGLYRYVRHPMYSSLLFLGWGAFFKQITPVSMGLIVFITCFLIAAARVEERENIRFFGMVYEAYMKRTKMFVPFLF